jgi:hypothetical protein
MHIYYLFPSYVHKKPPKEGSQLEEKIINLIVCRIICFILHELIHPLGKYRDPDGDVTKNVDLANCSGKGHGTMAIIQKKTLRMRRRVLN